MEKQNFDTKKQDITESFCRLLYQALLNHHHYSRPSIDSNLDEMGTDAMIVFFGECISDLARDGCYEELLKRWDYKHASHQGVVLGLYELLTRTYVGKEIQEKIWILLEKCSNHNFQKFVRLTNPRHNPNKRSRDRAMSILYQISTGFNSALGGCRGVQWQKGAKRIIDKLLKTGQFILDAHRD